MIFIVNSIKDYNFPTILQIGKKYPMPLRFIFTKGIAMFKPAIVKDREKNAKILTMNNVLNDQKYHEVLQNSKILHA